MSQNWFRKSIAGILIIATLLLASPVPVLAAPDDSAAGSYLCVGRDFSITEYLKNLWPSNAITNFFQESVCVSIFLSGLVVGNLACWIISTFIQPIFDPEHPACTPDSELAPDIDPAPDPPATTDPVAGTLSPPNLVKNDDSLNTVANFSITIIRSPNYI